MPRLFHIHQALNHLLSARKAPRSYRYGLFLAKFLDLWHCILMCTLRMYFLLVLYLLPCLLSFQKLVYLWLYCCCFNSHRTTSLCGLTLASPISVIAASKGTKLSCITENAICICSFVSVFPSVICGSQLIGL